MITKPTFTQKHNDPLQYYYFTNLFLPEEVQAIEKEAERYQVHRATISSQDQKETVRKSNISWIPPNESASWIYDRMFGAAEEANDVLWNFNLYNSTDEIQYTVYDGKEKGHYGAHVDIGPNELSTRKLSIVTQLSDPDDYENGDFQLLQGDMEWVDIPRGRGLTVVFPSYLYHRVTPVLSGTRKSLVLWAGGEHYK
jgi:PKHD-type hydroxylase